MPAKRGSKAVWISQRILAALEPLRAAASNESPRRVTLTQLIEEVLWDYGRGELVKESKVPVTEEELAEWERTPPRSGAKSPKASKGKQIPYEKASGE